MKFSVIPFCVVAAAIFSNQAVGHEYYAKSFKVIHPWAEPTAPDTKSADVYMRIEQISEGDRLLSAQTSFAEKVDLHVGAATTAAVEAIVLPPGPDIDLDAGTAYLRLVNLTAPLQWGRSYPMTLLFEKAGPVDVMISVGAH